MTGGSTSGRARGSCGGTGLAGRGVCAGDEAVAGAPRQARRRQQLLPFVSPLNSPLPASLIYLLVRLRHLALHHHVYSILVCPASTERDRATHTAAARRSIDVAPSLSLSCLAWLTRATRRAKGRDFGDDDGCVQELRALSIVSIELVSSCPGATPAEAAGHYTYTLILQNAKGCTAVLPLRGG